MTRLVGRDPHNKSIVLLTKVNSSYKEDQRGFAFDIDEQQILFEQEKEPESVAIGSNYYLR